MRGLAKLTLLLGGCTLIGAALTTPYTVFKKERTSLALRGTVAKSRLSHEEVAALIPSMMMDTKARASIIVDGKDGSVCGVLRTETLRGAREFIMWKDDSQTTLMVNIGSERFAKRWASVCLSSFIK